jgi:AraC-like DNA-binding protein
MAMALFTSQYSSMISSKTFFRDLDLLPRSVYVTHERTEVRHPSHSHQKGQFTYIDGGVAYIHIRDKTLIIPARHYIWIPRGVEHFIEMRKSVMIRCLYFYSTDDAAHPFYSRLGIYTINTLLLQMLIYSERWDGDILPTDQAFHFLAGIKNILPEISKKALPIALPTTDNERMKPVLAYINENISEALSLSLVSLQTSFSERTLSRLFQSTMGVSFLQYVKLLRMVKAIEMMLQTNQSMSEIAYSLGYKSLSAFSNIFYQSTKVRPSDFARQLS